MEVHAIPGTGIDSNVYVLTDGGEACIVDAGTGVHPERYIREIRDAVRGSVPTMLVLTHAHIDHAGGASVLARAFDIPVFMHEGDAPILEKGDVGASCAWMVGIRLEPVRVRRVKEGHRFPIGLRLLHTPGHTRGSISLYHPGTRTLFPGDTLFLYGGVGRWDLPTGDLETLLRSIEMLREVDVEGVYPGHGGFTPSGGNEHVELAYLSLKGGMGMP